MTTMLKGAGVAGALLLCSAARTATGAETPEQPGERLTAACAAAERPALGVASAPCPGVAPAPPPPPPPQASAPASAGAELPAPPAPAAAFVVDWRPRLDLGFGIGGYSTGAVKLVGEPSTGQTAVLGALTLKLRVGLIVVGTDAGYALLIHHSETYLGGHAGLAAFRAGWDYEIDFAAGRHGFSGVGSFPHHDTEAHIDLPYVGFHLNVSREVEPRKHLRVGLGLFGRWDVVGHQLTPKDIECDPGSFFHEGTGKCVDPGTYDMGGFAIGLAVQAMATVL